MVKKRRGGDGLGVGGDLFGGVEESSMLKKGKYSAEESRLVVEAARRLASQHGYADVSGLLSRDAKKEKMDSFRELALLFPERSPLSLYSHVKRQCHPGAMKGQWTEEETQQLREFVLSQGPNWSSFADELKRTPENCRDRYRQMFGEADLRVKKREKWTNKELDRLLTSKVDGIPLLRVDDASKISFVKVCKRVKTRGKQQCQRKWEQLRRINRSLLESPAHQLQLLQLIKQQQQQQQQNRRKASGTTGRQFFVDFSDLGGYDPEGSRACYDKLVLMSSSSSYSQQQLMQRLDEAIERLTERVNEDLLAEWDREDAKEAASDAFRKELDDDDTR